MMKQISIIFSLFIAILLVPVKGVSQSVSVNASCDSVMMWVGDQTKIHLEVTCDANQKVDFPLFQDTIINGIEIVPPVVTDTQYVNKKNRMIVTRDYTVTSFDSAFYYIPPFDVYVDTVKYSSESLALSVYMFDVDTLNADAFFGPKDIMAMPLKWKDLDIAVYSFVLFVVLLLVSLFLMRRYKDNKPIIRIIKLTPKLPPHKVALDMMEQLRSSQRAHSSDPKAYYTELTDILRSYIKERFDFDATEMTSYEIMERLHNSNDKESLQDLKMLLSTADLVKFAKFVPMLGENDQNLLNAIEFVKKTLVEPDPNIPAPKEEKVVVEEKRSKGARMAILIIIVLSSLIGVTALLLLIRQLYYLFF